MENNNPPPHLLWPNSTHLDPTEYYSKDLEYEAYQQNHRYHWNYCETGAHFQTGAPPESNNNGVLHQQEQIPPTKRR